MRQRPRLALSKDETMAERRAIDYEMSRLDRLGKSLVARIEREKQRVLTKIDKRYAPLLEEMNKRRNALYDDRRILKERCPFHQFHGVGSCSACGQGY